MLEQTVAERTAELRESEARYRSLTELASDWYWEQDERGAFTKVSGPALEMLGVRVGPLAGEAATTMRDRMERGGTASRCAQRSRIGSRFSISCSAESTTTVRVSNFQVSGEPMFNQSCRFIGYRGIGVELIARR